MGFGETESRKGAQPISEISANRSDAASGPPKTYLRRREFDRPWRSQWQSGRMPDIEAPSGIVGDSEVTLTGGAHVLPGPLRPRSPTRQRGDTVAARRAPGKSCRAIR